MQKGANYLKYLGSHSHCLFCLSVRPGDGKQVCNYQWEERRRGDGLSVFRSINLTLRGLSRDREDRETAGFLLTRTRHSYLFDGSDV